MTQIIRTLSPLLVAIALSACQPVPWHEGGTLYDASAQEWTEATETNRLATTATFVAEYEALPWNTDEERLAISENILYCIDGLVERTKQTILAPIQKGDIRAVAWFCMKSLSGDL